MHQLYLPRPYRVTTAAWELVGLTACSLWDDCARCSRSLLVRGGWPSDKDFLEPAEALVE